MALRKPSDFFGKNNKENKNIPVVETDNSLREELTKVESLSEQLSQLQQELTQKVVQTDLEKLVLSQINTMQENFTILQEEFQQSNERDISKFRETVVQLGDIVGNLVENEIPKYKKQITSTDVRISQKFNEFKEVVEDNIDDIREDVETKVENIASAIDDNLEYFNQQLQETSSGVKKTVDTYNKLSKIVESRIEKENDQLEEYSKIIQSLHESFIELEASLKEEVSVSRQKVEEQIETYKNEITSEQLLSEKKLEIYKNELEISVDNLLENYQKELKDVKADVVITEQHIKNVDKYLKENHQELIELKEEVFAEIEKLPLGDVQENVRKLERKLEYIEEVYKNIEPEVIVKEVIQEGLLNEPPSTDNKDPLTPLDQNFVTLDQLQQHYRLFINRIQQQLATLGGGGETQLKYLDDIVGIATNPSVYNQKVLTYDHTIQKFEFRNIPENAVSIAEENIVYVAKDGSDSNDGTLTSPKLTIKAAVESIVSAGVTDRVVRVAPGTYIEDNPIILPDEVTVIGQSLRETTVIPQNDDQDLFYVGNGNYIAEMSFRGSLPNKAIIAFDPVKPRYIVQSPYIQNCTNFIPDSIGLKVDGNAVIGPIKSMVLDSYTQYNQGGIGASITNQGYAQLVSLFTICDDIAIYCGNGGACDLTNSNSSFGNYGLVADGVSPKKYSGIITSPSASLSETFVVDLSTPELSVSNAVYDNVSGIVTITTSSPHRFNIGMGVSIAGLGFTCSSGPGILTYPSGNKGYVFNARTVAPGRYFDSYNLIQANRQEIIDNSYAAINVAYPSFVNPDPDKCKRDIGYIVDAISIDVRDFTSKNTIEATKSYFKYDGSELITNGILGEVPQTIVGFTSARDLIKLAITNNLTVKDLTIAPDPETGSNTDPASCSDVRSFVDNLVGIITTRLDAGNLIGVNALPLVSMASTTFSAYVGVSTLQHTYVSGGTVKTEVVRPYDGQAIYFNDLYNTVKTIAITDGGSGYTSPPIVTIDAPSASWGVRAKAIATVENGSVTQIDILSNGRGYTTTPSVTFSAPQTGINTAIGAAVLTPEYYTINKSTEISNGISTITLNENVPFAVGVGTEVNFFKQSRILATGHSFEFIGSGTDIANSIPFNGGSPPIPENETDSRNGGLVVYTSTNQSGNFKIGDGVTINQNTSSITGQAYEKSLVSTMTPYILSLGAL